MKRCPYCRREYGEDVVECPTDRSQLGPPQPDFPRRSFVACKISIGAGIIGNGLIVLSCLPFVAIPRGTGIRPMSWAVWVFLIALCTLVVGLPSALISFRSSSRLTSILALVLSLSPWPLAGFVLRAIAAMFGLQIEE